MVFGHRDHHCRTARGVAGVELPIAHARAIFDRGQTPMQTVPVPDLITSVAQPAATTLTPTLLQPSKQFAMAAIDVVKTCCDGFCCDRGPVGFAVHRAESRPR